MLDMKRREFITLLGGVASAWPLAARAQQAIPVIGFLHPGSPSSSTPHAVAFRQGLNETGFIEGQNLLIEYRWAASQYDQLPVLASDLVDRRVAEIAATATASALAAKATRTTIPIVFVIGSDPTKLGLVTSLERPGGNITGVSVLGNLSPLKLIDLAHELRPTAAKLGLLLHPTDPKEESDTRGVELAAEALGAKLVIVKAGTKKDFESAFERLAHEQVAALFVNIDPFLEPQREQVVALAVRHALPAIYPVREFAAVGGLMSYGPSLSDAHRQAGIYSGRILRGEKPIDLPVVQLTKFELVINLTTAKVLGLAIPPGILAIADEVIE